MSISVGMLRTMLPPVNPSTTPCWLALRLPHLALDRVSRGQALPDRPLAISALVGRRECIVDANPAARKRGIRPGIPASAAAGILQGLHLLPREPQREYEVLEGLATWCYQYSSHVSLPQGGGASSRDTRPVLWLEAGASQRLFGPPARLGQRLERELGRLGYHAVAGSAPTPEAAWLAAGENRHIVAGELRQQVGLLPVRCLNLDGAQHHALEQMGFRQVREVLRLPRKALTRRFGPAVADYIDRLLGTRPDPRQAHAPPQVFHGRMELPAEISASQALLFPLKRLLDELCGVLRGGDTAVQSLDIILRHEDHPDSRLQFGMHSPTRDAERLLRLARERLERLRLPRAVREIRLEAARLLPFRAGQRSLFRGGAEEQRQDIEHLAERLQARLGREAVSGVTGVEDHRPEYSWRPRALAETPRCAALAHRPAWLLPHPRRCDIRHYQLVAGPERIETGWWDGHDCRRDYFIVRDAQGSLLWAFHEYKPQQGWFLHGVFA